MKKETLVIGQDHLLKKLDLIFKAFKNSDGEIRPHFILTGPSGNGKTETIEYFKSKYNLPVVELNAAGLTKEGMSGNSISKALSPLKNYQNQACIAFIDEFDKLYLSSDGSSDSIHEATRGVQNEFLKALENTKIQVFADYGKYESISVSKVLFVFAGAFNNETGINIHRLSELGVKREFLGRVSLIYEVKKLSVEELMMIADKHWLLDQWLELQYEKDSYEYTTERSKALDKIKAYIKHNYDDNVIGARWVPSLINKYFINNKTLPIVEKENHPVKERPLINLYEEETNNDFKIEETPFDNDQSNIDPINDLSSDFDLN